MSTQVITANALVEGDVVYLSTDGHWERSLAAAQVFSDALTADNKLAAATARSGEVVGVYLMGVAIVKGVPQPKHFREAFRQTGPSNKVHGKQADAQE